MPNLARRAVLKIIGLQAGAWALSRAAPARTLRVASAAPVLRSSVGTQTSIPLPMTQRLAQFVRRTRYEDLPSAVVRKAKEQMVYHFGLAFGGVSTEEAERARAVTRSLALPRGATAIAEGYRLSLSDAAFYNTTLMRSLWRDDVTWPTGIHAGIMTLPPGLAVAETRRCRGSELLVAYVLAYEVMCKLSRAADPWSTAQPRRPTMVYGAYGPITVAGRLMQLNETQLANAYGYAANLAMGVPEGGQTQHFYGLLSRNATFGAELAEVGGAPYSPYTLEGGTGLYTSFFGELPKSLPHLIDSLGTDWEILTAAQKRYPGTGQNTVATEVLKDLLHQERLTANDVTRIDVYTGFVNDSMERQKELTSRGPFKTWVDAWSSLPYALAVVLIHGEMDPARYQTNLEDHRVNAAMYLINFHTESGHDGPRYARVEVATRDGRKLSRASDNVIYPFPPEAWGPWLEQDGVRLLSVEQLQELKHLLINVEELDDVARLTATLVPNAQSRR